MPLFTVYVHKLGRLVSQSLATQIMFLSLYPQCIRRSYFLRYHHDVHTREESILHKLYSPGCITKTSPITTPVDPKQLFHIHCSVRVHVCGYTSSWRWQLLIHVNREQHESQETYSDATRFWLFVSPFVSETVRGRQGRRQGRRQVGDKWETSGKMQARKRGGTWFSSWDSKKTQRSQREQKTETNTKHKWNHDETRTGHRPLRQSYDRRQMTSETDEVYGIQMVRDKWWKTHKGEQAIEPDTTKADRWLETNQLDVSLHLVPFIFSQCA